MITFYDDVHALIIYDSGYQYARMLRTGEHHSGVLLQKYAPGEAVKTLVVRSCKNILFWL